MDEAKKRSKKAGRGGSHAEETDMRRIVKLEAAVRLRAAKKTRKDQSEWLSHGEGLFVCSAAGEPEREFAHRRRRRVVVARLRES